MENYTVVVCTKARRSLTSPMPKLEWHSEQVTASDPYAATEAAYTEYRGNARTRAYVIIYQRDTHGLISLLTGLGDPDLSNELRAELDSTHAHYHPDFPWHRDEFDSERCAEMYERLSSDRIS